MKRSGPADQLLIATAAQGMVRLYAARTTQAIAAAQTIHQTWPTATATLGRLLSAALMLGVMDDNLRRLTLTIAGDGPAGRVLAVSNQRAQVKGWIANPQVDLELNPAGKLDVAKAVGSGYLAVIKDLGLKEPYQGVVPLQSGEIATDLAYYFAKSEQIPSAVALGVLVNPDGSVQAAGGLIVQLLPGAAPELLEYWERKLAALPQLTSIFNSGTSPRRLLQDLAGGDDLKLLETVSLAYHCDCCRERFRGPLLALGREELDEILNQSGQIEVRCQFCNRVYHYQSLEELQEARKC